MYRYLLVLLMFFSTLYANDPIQPLPKTIAYDKEKALLGKKLYFDPILSKDNTVSCASCHNLELGGVDNLQFSFGIKGQKGIVNTPTVLNSIFNFRQMWDGRVKTLTHQVKFPITNPKEMGNSFKNLIKTLNKNSYYNKTFNALYQNGITKENIGDALEEFQKTLITPSAFDDYLRGDKNAITENQKKGYELFNKKGCVSCHNGINIGGGLYAQFGLTDESIANNLINHSTKDGYNPDFGLYNITKNDFDKFYFKVPTLRNVALTYPYLHNGQIKTLNEAISSIAKAQLGLNLTDEETFLIEEFLKSLSGKVNIIK
ncbi:MAG: cytochrome-c peroxidase [Arcobacter sp.]|uniref:cytochrome-c peroxidase n=1 Tax=Arcobacter sp. TaxID=1872629 RepID=UPI003B000406